MHAYLTSNGRLTIPAELRRKLHIRKGTRVVFTEDGYRLVLLPVTRQWIDSLCGCLKRRPGEKPVTQQLLDDRAEDLRHEDRRWKRFQKRMPRPRERQS